MLDDENSMTTESTEAQPDGSGATAPAAKAPAKKAAAKKAPAKKTAAKKAPAKKTAAAPPADEQAELALEGDAALAVAEPAKKAAAKKAPAKKAAAKKTTTKKAPAAAELPADLLEDEDEAAALAAAEALAAAAPAPVRAPVAPMALLFQAPEPVVAPKRTRKAAQPKPAPEPEAAQDEAEGDAEPDAVVARTPRKRTPQKSAEKAAEPADEVDESEQDEDRDDRDESEDSESEQAAARRRRRRGGRRRRKPSDGEGGEDGEDSDDESDNDAEGAEGRAGDDNGQGEGGGTRRRRVRVRAGEGGGQGSDDPNTVTRVRQARTGEDQITSVAGSTRLEAKKQRRREGREAGRRRAPIVSEAEFLARRESVDRVMVIRQRRDVTQIAVLEDKVLVEHYVARESQNSLIGNVYVGRVQNVLPSMEAAFVDIGKGRNAVLYAGEVNWSSLGHKDGQPRKIESFLSSGQSILVQVTKDPIGHKGARLTSQVSLAGRFLVYVPDGTTSGISRKLPDTERSRLKTLLKEIVPDTAGVIVRTAAEGASEEELTRDVERLKARWEDIEAKAKSGNSPQLLYGEPDLTLKVVRDLFTEDFGKLVIQGDEAWETVQGYVEHVAPDLADRLERFDGDGEAGDAFAAYRIDEQIAKGLDRKVWLPSGGSLVIDRTEAMTVVDVNTGKFTGSGGNLEETVTKNNLEAAEEIVRQLRLRDIGGIIVVDFIDMVLESNRDLVLRRLVECLGRDRTRHQVAEVTSLGLVQMTRKRIGTGLLEAFSENCEHCQGRGVVVHDLPVEARKTEDGDRRGRRGRGRDGASGGSGGNQPKAAPPTPKDVAAVARPENADRPDGDAETGTEPERSAPDNDTDTGAGVETEAAEQTTREPRTRDRGGRDRGNRGQGNRRQGNRDEGNRDEGSEPAAVEPAVEPAAEPSVEPAAVEPAPEPTAVEPVTGAVSEPPVETGPPAAPKVVTRTRRAASRPAGATPGTPALEPVTIVVPEALAEAPVHTPVVEAPKVITRTRRVVSRPAGAASAAGAAEASAEPAEAAADVVAADDHAGAELHVPIKKKGARKR